MKWKLPLVCLAALSLILGGVVAYRKRFTSDEASQQTIERYAHRLADQAQWLPTRAGDFEPVWPVESLEDLARFRAMAWDSPNSVRAVLGIADHEVSREFSRCLEIQLGSGRRFADKPFYEELAMDLVSTPSGLKRRMIGTVIGAVSLAGPLPRGATIEESAFSEPTADRLWKFLHSERYSNDEELVWLDVCRGLLSQLSAHPQLRAGMLGLGSDPKVDIDRRRFLWRQQAGSNSPDLERLRVAIELIVDSKNHAMRLDLATCIIVDLEALYKPKESLTDSVTGLKLRVREVCESCPDPIIRNRIVARCVLYGDIESTESATRELCSSGNDCARGSLWHELSANGVLRENAALASVLLDRVRHDPSSLVRGELVQLLAQSIHGDWSTLVALVRPGGNSAEAEAAALVRKILRETSELDSDPKVRQLASDLLNSR